MAEWLYTNVLHEPRKALGISVLEYCVLDYIYKTQTHPIYGKNGWTNAGCHRVAAFFDLSSGTVKKLFDRMDKAGLLERVANDMKRATEKFYSIAYESDVQKVNDYRLQSEQQGVQKVNSNRSKSEQYNKKNKIEIKKEYKEPQIENDFLVETNEEFEGMAITGYELISSTQEQTPPPNSEAPHTPKKERKSPKYIFPPTQEELVQPMFAKLQEKKRDHPNIVDCWNHANMQAEKFFLHHEAKGWKIERLNSAIALWVNNAIGYGQVTKPCPIQYKGNPANAQPAQPTKVHVEQPVLTQQDIEASEQHFAGVRAMFKQMGV